MSYKAIIFDLDGTIINTENIWHQASHELIETHAPLLGKAEKKHLFTSIHGLALHQSCRLIKEVAQIDLPVEVLMQEKSARAHELYQKEVRFIRGFVTFHKQLQRMHLKSGIATNATPETAELTDKMLNLRRFFGEHIYNVAHVNYQNKPNPALYLFAAQQLEVDPHYCIAIEDSAHGIAAAKSAGMYCIGINTAKNPAQLAAADRIVDHYRDINLLEIIK